MLCGLVAGLHAATAYYCYLFNRDEFLVYSVCMFFIAIRCGEWITKKNWIIEVP